MFGFFNPRYINDGHEMIKAARKMLAYKRDLLRPEDLGALETKIAGLETAIDKRDREQVLAEIKNLDDSFGALFPPRSDAAIRENCEVFFVAIVIAVGIRTFFLQPFTIPTGSMQPTLNGIIAHNTGQPAPNLLTQAFAFVAFGRNYVDVVSKVDDTVLTMEEFTRFRFFTFTKVQCEHQQFTIPAPAKNLEQDFQVTHERSLKAGEVVARGYVETGDHVFVDKMSYNFRNPHRGEVFVFTTAGIQTHGTPVPGETTQFYIKRLAGLPGDILRIDQPNLFVNGQRAQGFAFERVMAARDGYQGYSNPPYGARYLTSPDTTFHVPDASYFALGDNSFNSLDSRYWGVVPAENLMGRGLFVYWPFTSHWGLIK